LREIGWPRFPDLQVIKHLIGRDEQILQHAPEVCLDPAQQYGIAAKLLSNAEGRTIDGQKEFEQLAKLGK
jgi:hypothetical protein